MNCRDQEIVEDNLRFQTRRKIKRSGHLLESDSAFN